MKKLLYWLLMPYWALAWFFNRTLVGNSLLICGIPLLTTLLLYKFVVMARGHDLSVDEVDALAPGLIFVCLAISVFVWIGLMWFDDLLQKFRNQIKSNGHRH